MPTMIQIRNVPSDVHRELKIRATEAGMTLSDFLLAELRRTLERPTREEFLRRLADRSPVRVRPSPAEAVRKERAR